MENERMITLGALSMVHIMDISKSSQYVSLHIWANSSKWYNTYILCVLYIFYCCQVECKSGRHCFFVLSSENIQKSIFKLQFYGIDHSYYICSIFHFKWYVHLCSQMCLMSGWKLILIPKEKWFLFSTKNMYYSVLSIVLFFIHSYFVWNMEF